MRNTLAFAFAFGLSISLAAGASSAQDRPPAESRDEVNNGNAPPPATPDSTIQTSKPGPFDLPYESESSLGGKFDIKLQVVGAYRNPTRFHVTGTLKNTDIGRQYDGSFEGTMPMSGRVVTLTYNQPRANAHGTVVFTFSEDGETFTGDGMHMGTTPFKWTGRRKH